MSIAKAVLMGFNPKSYGYWL